MLSPTSTADPAVRPAVEQGLVKVSDAASIVTRPAEVQRQALDRVLSRQSKALMAAVKRTEAENARRRRGNPSGPGQS